MALLIIAEKSYDKNVIPTNKISTRLVYTELLASFYNKQPKEIIGVTGTNGKTSTVEFADNYGFKQDGKQHQWEPLEQN